jgi:RNA polymerase sigma factor (sigma-70 family)
VIGNGSLQEGGEDPLAALLQGHSQPLEAFIAHRVRGDGQAVEDLTQLTIMHVVAYHDRTGGLPPGDEAVRLLYKIAERRVYDWYQQRSAHTTRTVLCPSDSDLLTEAVSSTEPIDESVARRIDLTRALSRLTPAQRRALVLVYVDGLSYQTAAAVMGISIDGLKGHLKRATQRARHLHELTGYRAPASAEGGAS